MSNGVDGVRDLITVERAENGYVLRQSAYGEHQIFVVEDCDDFEDEIFFKIKVLRQFAELLGVATSKHFGKNVFVGFEPGNSFEGEFDKKEWEPMRIHYERLQRVFGELKLDEVKFHEVSEQSIEIDGKTVLLSQFLEMKDLKVSGDLDLSGTEIISLPAGLSVGGDFNLYGTPITSLPEGLSVGGGLNLFGTKITSLPAGLSVGGNLDLYGTPITSLPKDLKVGGDLYLGGTPIASWPKDLKVGGKVMQSGLKQ